MKVYAAFGRERMDGRDRYTSCQGSSVDWISPSGRPQRSGGSVEIAAFTLGETALYGDASRPRTASTHPAFADVGRHSEQHQQRIEPREVTLTRQEGDSVLLHADRRRRRES